MTAHCRALYLDLVKRVLANTIYADDRRDAAGGRLAYAQALRETGSDWPIVAHTMVGMRRLDNLQHCVQTVIDDGVPGDLIETGVWRGGATVLMRAVLEAYGERTRTVWVADSFEGLPPPDASRFPADRDDRHHELDYLRVSEDDVRETFRRYGLLDDQVRFLKGWFRDTLPSAPIERLAVLRLDGDMYESTMQALDALYPKLSPGGFAIVDDYGAIPACRQATDDYRARHGIGEPLQAIDWTGVFWRRSR
jgi:O-methyltransferase